jgi:DNA polymerase III delta prime subunit
MLIVLSGLPGVGKTTIARELARSLVAVHLRIDSIEQALRQTGWAVEAEGYAVAQAVAVDNLRVGHTVVADCPSWRLRSFAVTRWSIAVEWNRAWPTSPAIECRRGKRLWNGTTVRGTVADSSSIPRGKPCWRACRQLYPHCDLSTDGWC